MKRLLSVLICVMLALPLLPSQVLAEEDPVTVTIFTTNDIHGVLEGEGTVGIVQAAAIKASTPHALLVDAGDATQGASFATISQGEDVIRMMNAAGYDVMAAGNHEFDYGTDRLLANAKAANFPILSANVTLNGSSMLPGSTVVEIADKSIGFIGLTTVNTATSTNPSKLGGVRFGDEIEAAKAQITALEGETDAIVIVCHLGDLDSAVDCTSGKLLDALEAAELSEVTAVIDGHSHTLEQGNYTRDGVSIPVVQTGTMFTAIGKIELTFDDDTVTADGTVLDAKEAKSYTLTEKGQDVAAKVQKTLDSIKSEQAEILQEILCTNETPLWGGNIYWDYSEPRVVETSYGDFVTDAFAEAAKSFSKQNGLSLPIIGLENGGGISATLPMGQVTRGDVLNAFNHGNMVEVMEITPAQLRTALENGLTVTGQEETGLLVRERVSGSFLQISGFTYTYDPSAASGEKVVSIELNDGTSLNITDTNTRLLLATNSYVGSSFTSMGAEKLGELGGEDQIVMEYIQSLTSGGKALAYDSGAERIRIAGDKSPDTYTVTIPVLLASDRETAQPNATVHLRVDSGDIQELTTDENGNIVLEVTRGAHTFYLEESTDGQPVYTNNYSGSGTATTREGYYRLGFLTKDLALEAEIARNLDLLQRNVQNIREDIEGRLNLSEEERNAYLQQLEEMAGKAEADISEAKTPEEAADLLDTWLDAIVALSNKAWVDGCIKWADYEGANDFDRIIEEYEEKLPYVSEEEIAAIREALEKAGKEIGEAMRTLAADHVFEGDNPGEDPFYVEFEGLMDSFYAELSAAVHQVFLTNAQNRLDAVAEETKDAIQSLENQHGLEPGEYLDAVDQKLAEAKRALLAVNAPDSIYDPEAVAAVFEALETAMNAYETEIRNVLAEATPEEPGQPENPSQPGTEAPSQPGTEAPTQPGTEAPDQSESETPDQPASEEAESSEPEESELSEKSEEFEESEQPDSTESAMADSTETGDENSLLLFVFLLVLSSCGLVVLLRSRNTRA